MAHPLWMPSYVIPAPCEKQLGGELEKFRRTIVNKIIRPPTPLPLGHPLWMPSYVIPAPCEILLGGELEKFRRIIVNKIIRPPTPLPFGHPLWMPSYVMTLIDRNWPVNFL